MKILLSTIWHSGSEYMRRELRDQGHNVTFQHCESQVWKVLNGTTFDEIHTTLRDPHLVAASWANQYNIEDTFIDTSWYIMWMNWFKLTAGYDVKIHYVDDFDGEPVNSKGDRLGLKRALELGDMDYYFKWVPRDWISYALRCCKYDKSKI